MSTSPSPRSSKTSFILPAIGQPVDDWTLLKGQMIEVHVNDQLIDHGWVDDIMVDGSLLWLIHNGASGRRIIEKLPGTLVLLKIDNASLGDQ